MSHNAGLASSSRPCLPCSEIAEQHRSCLAASMRGAVRFSSPKSPLLHLQHWLCCSVTLHSCRDLSFLLLTCLKEVGCALEPSFRSLRDTVTVHILGGGIGLFIGDKERGRGGSSSLCSTWAALKLTGRDARGGKVVVRSIYLGVCSLPVLQK